jgi:hypothetical protein
MRFLIFLLLSGMCSIAFAANDWTKSTQTLDPEATAYTKVIHLGEVVDEDEDSGSKTSGTDWASDDATSSSYDIGNNAASTAYSTVDCSYSHSSAQHSAQTTVEWSHSGVSHTSGWSAWGQTFGDGKANQKLTPNKDGVAAGSLEFDTSFTGVPDEVDGFTVKAFAGGSWIKWTYTKSNDTWTASGQIVTANNDAGKTNSIDSYSATPLVGWTTLTSILDEDWSQNVVEDQTFYVGGSCNYDGLEVLNNMENEEFGTVSTVGCEITGRGVVDDAIVPWE